jgi:hypothetical protein
MARFWLATFEPKAGRPRRPLPPAVQPFPSLAAPLVSSDDLALAVEVIEDKGEYAVLFSVVDDPKTPTEFTCRIGFANGAKSCNVWTDRGFPLLDAAIERTKDNVIAVHSPCFVGTNPAMQYKRETVLVAKLPRISRAPKSTLLSGAEYKQALRTPDIASPATHIGSVAIAWAPQSRSNVKESQRFQSTYKVNPSRYFDLRPFPNKPAKPIRLWSGNIELPVWKDRRVSRGKLVTSSRSDTFGVAAFEFEDVEVLGFRIDPRRTNQGKPDLGKLSELVAPLNFHRNLSTHKFSAVTRSAVSDFQFSPAAYTVMIELLHYGKMKLKTAAQPLTTADYQSQHEFLARMIVGRVDDDTAQARDPATFVPAIFVDNPWSKSLGRTVQGFDKRMADFFVGAKDLLRPDGRVDANEKQPRPLGSITKIALTDKTGRKPGATLIELDCPPEALDDRAFETVDPRLALGPVPIAPMGWLQTDFDQAEYRRAFARSVMKDRFKEFNSIQVSPVGATGLRQQLERQTTWITGAMKFVRNVQLAQPNGTARLTFHTDPSTPKAWDDLCKLFGIDEDGKSHIIMPARTWYRMRCSLNLNIKNGLD